MEQPSHGDTRQTGETPSFALLTPAHNEGEHLPELVESIVAQERRPDCWVIVNDASTDNTSEVAHQAAATHDFIHVLDRTRDGGRRIGYKAEAVNAGYEMALSKCPGMGFVASTDADLVFPTNTFSFLLDRFAERPRLGVAGGKYSEMVNGRMREGRRSPTHVPGALQVFRREVFDAIGGYQLLTHGAIDVVSTANARMLGWETRSFDEIHFFHRRQMGTSGDLKPVVALYRQGVRDYSVGTSAWFEMAKCIRRTFVSPPVIGTLSRLAGYTVARLKRVPTNVPPDVARFIRAEQLERLSPSRLWSSNGAAETKDQTFAADLPVVEEKA